MTELVSSLLLLEVVDPSPQIRDTPVRSELHLPPTLQKMTVERRLIELLDWISKINLDNEFSRLGACGAPKISQFLSSQGEKVMQLALRSTYSWMKRRGELLFFFLVRLMFDLSRTSNKYLHPQ
jgi:hypothetical protein